MWNFHFVFIYFLLSLIDWKSKNLGGEEICFFSHWGSLHVHLSENLLGLYIHIYNTREWVGSVHQIALAFEPRMLCTFLSISRRTTSNSDGSSSFIKRRIACIKWSCLWSFSAAVLVLCAWPYPSAPCWAYRLLSGRRIGDFESYLCACDYGYSLITLWLCLPAAARFT